MSSEDAVIAVHEERARIGDVELAKKTILAATDEGVVAFEITTAEKTESGYPMGTLPCSPRVAALPGPSQVVVVSPPERDCKYYCCACDSQHEWYSLKGKGICWVLLLIFMYLIVGIISIPIALLLLWCLFLLNSEQR